MDEEVRQDEEQEEKLTSEYGREIDVYKRQYLHHAGLLARLQDEL